MNFYIRHVLDELDFKSIEDLLDHKLITSYLTTTILDENLGVLANIYYFNLSPIIEKYFNTHCEIVIVL